MKCSNCHETIISDGYGEYTHTALNEKGEEIFGSYFCHPHPKKGEKETSKHLLRARP